MADPKMTPEEKLLRIIETPAEAMHAMRPRRRIQDLKFSLKLFKDTYAPKVKDFFNLKTVNTFLFFLAAIATVCLILDFWIGVPRANVILRLESAAKKINIGDMAIERLDPLSLYMQEIAHRNIFSLPQPAAKASAQKPEPSANVKSFMDTLKLVGIIWSEAPQAIIEDSKDGRTYLLNRGASIKDARVKEILKDRVILSYDNQDVELL